MPCFSPPPSNGLSRTQMPIHPLPPPASQKKRRRKLLDSPTGAEDRPFDRVFSRSSRRLPSLCVPKQRACAENQGEARVSETRERKDDPLRCRRPRRLRGARGGRLPPHARSETHSSATRAGFIRPLAPGGAQAGNTGHPTHPTLGRIDTPDTRIRPETFASCALL